MPSHALIHPNKHNRIIIFQLAALFTVLLVLGGCESKQINSDPNLVKKIQEQNWPKCSEQSEKTIYDGFFENEEFAERLILAGRVSSVIEELEESREKFRRTRDLKEIFPLLYFHQTKESLDFAMKPRIVNKIEFLQIVLNTFDAYKANRDAFDRGEPDSVDRQWRSYFKAADKAQNGEAGIWLPEDGVDVLLDGVNAHVLYDLPRAIREVIKTSDSDIDELTRDFTAADSIYPVAEENAKREILNLFRSAADREAVQKLFGNGAEYVKFSRQKAWEMGVGDGPLGLLEEQPHFEHSADSRRYFPEELIERGICR